MILYSDTAITWIDSDFETLIFHSSVKGLFFVVVTGLLLFFQLRRSIKALSDADLRADNAVLESASAREAPRLDKERWKLIVTDLGLPKFGGAELVRKIRSIESTIPVLAESGYLDPNDRAELTRLGVGSFLQKPYLIEELLLAIRSTLSKPV